MYSKTPPANFVLVLQIHDLNVQVFMLWNPLLIKLFSLRLAGRCTGPIPKESPETDNPPWKNTQTSPWSLLSWRP